MSAGYVYVLSNESMPGVVKIGRSKNGGRVRAKQIYSGATGVPSPFKMEFELWAEHCESLEVEVHDLLWQERVSNDREFFKLDVDEAIQAVMRCYCFRFDFVVAHADTVITDEDIIDHRSQTYKVAEELFPESPEHLVTMTALKICLETQDVERSIRNYRKWVDSRKELRNLSLVGFDKETA